jgi:3-oxoacyl-[acyl-carrier-protein] synthase-3
MNKVYINAIGSFLPGEPISNEAMENYIGKINGQKSRLGPLILRQNRIKKRHYAMGQDGTTIWTAASLVAKAINQALQESEVMPRDVSFLAAATSQSDFLVPGFASMVHGELKDFPALELASFQSVCASSMMALKDAYLQIKATEHSNAVVGAGEFASRFFQPGFYENTQILGEDGLLPMSAEFLRWTLSDGAGALVLENRPNQHRHSLEIEWISLRSFANRFQPCMYAGGVQEPIMPWGNFMNPEKAHKSGSIALQQDFQLLSEMLPVWVGEFAKLIEEHRLSMDTMDWFLCHYSTHSLKLALVTLLEKAGCMVPPERWFTNLYEKGNTGSASMFVMLDELFHSNDLKKGQRIFCIVPESGRSIISFMMLKVV